MADNRKISLVIPYYNRADEIINCIEYPLTDDRISEIVICDNVSKNEDYYKMLELVQPFKKVKVVRNVINFHVQHSKRNAINFATNDWVICLDNDNTITKEFIDTLYCETWNPEYIYHPAFASPKFDYRQFNGDIITKENVAPYCKKPIFVTLLNTNNFLVNRAEYLKVYQYNNDVRGADGIYNQYNWLKSGRAIYIVPNLTYNHKISHDSAFLSEAEENMKKIYYWLDKVCQLN